MEWLHWKRVSTAGRSYKNKVARTWLETPIRWSAKVKLMTITQHFWRATDMVAEDLLHCNLVQRSEKKWTQQRPVDTLDNGNTLDTMDVSIGGQSMQMSMAMRTELLDHMRTLDTQSGRRGHNHPLIGNPFLGIPGSRISRTTRPNGADMVQHMAIGSPTADNWTVGEHRERRLLTTMVREEVRRRTNNQFLLDARRQTNKMQNIIMRKAIHFWTLKIASHSAKREGSTVHHAN